MLDISCVLRLFNITHTLLFESLAIHISTRSISTSVLSAFLEHMEDLFGRETDSGI